MVRGTTMGAMPVPVRGGAARGRGRASLDIENLLIWAYQRQRVHALDGGGVGLHEVERLASGIEWGATSADGVATIQRIAALGCRVDGGGYSHGEVHGDAEIVHRAVIGLKDDLDIGLVIMCATAARRPECYEGKQAELVPDRDAKGRAISLRDAHGNALVGQYRMRWNIRPEVLDSARLLYLRWWDALDVLAKGLAGGMREHVATGPAASREPWSKKGA